MPGGVNSGGLGGGGGGNLTGVSGDLPMNPVLGDFAEIGGVMKQWDGYEWVG